MSISLCMIVKNEERFLRQCLNSVKDLVDEMIIVDTGSVDKTKDIAKEFGAKVFDFKWADDFSAARNFSLSKATGDWILVMDADETVSARDIPRIKQFAELKDFEGFFFTLRNYANSQYVHNWQKLNDNYEESAKYDTWYSADLIRMFRNKKNHKFKNKLHEVVDIPKGQVGITHIPIHHFGWDKYVLNRQAKKAGYKKVLLDSLKDKPDDLKNNYELARMYIEDLDFTNAEELLKKCIKLYEKLSDKNSIKGWMFYESLAQVYVLSEKFDEAADILKKAIKVEENNPSINALLGDVLVSLGKFEESKEYFKKALQFLKDNPNMLISVDTFFNSYGIALLNTGKLKEAAHAFGQAFRTNPLNANAYNNMGVVLLRADKLKDALIVFKKAVELNHENKNEILETIAKIESKMDKK